MVKFLSYQQISKKYQENIRKIAPLFGCSPSRQIAHLSAKPHLSSYSANLSKNTNHKSTTSWEGDLNSNLNLHFVFFLFIVSRLILTIK